MGSKVERTKLLEEYIIFLDKLDTKLDSFFKEHQEYICCCKGCSYCCEKGDYPLSEIELQYLMQGYTLLDNNTKIIVQNNFSQIKKGGKCPFLVDSLCSVYKFRPIICRVHGLAYLCQGGIAKIPYCVNKGKNYTNVYDGKDLLTEPIKFNLDTAELLKDFDTEIRNLYDWVIKN